MNEDVPPEEGDTNPEDSDEGSNGEESQANPDHSLSDEQIEANDTLERMLRRVPDQPGNLLRNKFQAETRRRYNSGELDYNELRQRNRW